jgi:hypothetical protein
VVIDKSGANLARLENMNCLLIMNGWFWLIDTLQVKYLNNIIEQDHRFIKKLTKQMKGFKSFTSASATLDGVGVAYMIRKKQFGASTKTAFQQFAGLAGQLCPEISAFYSIAYYATESSCGYPLSQPIIYVWPLGLAALISQSCFCSVCIRAPCSTPCL